MHTRHTNVIYMYYITVFFLLSKHVVDVSCCALSSNQRPSLDVVFFFWVFTDGVRSVHSPADQSPPGAGASAKEQAARESELVDMEARLVAIVEENVSSRN